MDIVDRIFELVDEYFEEQQQFAAAIGVTPSIVSEWRKRKSASFRKSLPQIAEALNTNVQWLLTGENEKSRPATTLEGSGRSVEFAKLFKELTPENQKLIIAAMRGMKSDK